MNIAIKEMAFEVRSLEIQGGP